MNTRRHMCSNRCLVVLCVATFALVMMLSSVCAYGVEDASQAAATVVAGTDETGEAGEGQTSSGSEEQSSGEEGAQSSSDSDVPPQEPTAEDQQVTEESADADSATDAEVQESATDQQTTAPVQQGPQANDQAMSVTVVFVGLDGEWGRSTLFIEEGSTAWEATIVALGGSALTYDTGTATADDVIVSLARGYDDVTYALDTATGSAWHLYLNDERYQGSASTLDVEDGDVIEWRFEVGTVTVSVSVVGPGGTGLDYWIAPTNVEVEATQSAWDASRIVFEQNGYVDGRLLSYVVGEDGSIELESLASLGANGITGETWQVFVNGAHPEENVAHVGLHTGDSICWYYAGNGENELPVFAAKTGAASQSPAATVHLDGNVSQAWTHVANDSETFASRINAAAGVSVSGASGLWSLAATSSQPFACALPLGTSTSRWHSSLSHLIDAKLGTGQGGRAAFGADGGLYYLDELGAVVKLELTK